MPLTIQDKVNIRRHLGYPVAGLLRISPAGGTIASAGNAYRFFESYGQLEYRMNQLAPSEEATLTGKAYGAIGFNNSNTPIVPSTVISVTLNSTAFGGANPITHNYTVQASDTLLTICGEISNLFALDTNFTGAGFYAINDYGSGPWSEQIVPFPIASFIGPDNTTSFTIAVSGGGNTQPQVVANGQLQPPVITINTTIPPLIIYGYLPILDYLEGAYGAVTSDLSTHKSREWTRNPHELAEQRQIYNQWRYRLAAYLGLSIDRNNHAYNKSFGCNRLMI